MLDELPWLTLHRRIPPLPAHDDPDYWRKIREQFPMPPDEAYCNTGTIGASPLRVLHAVVGHTVRSMAEVAHVDWSGGGMSLLSGYSPDTELRTKIGELINADPSLVALTQNTHTRNGGNVVEIAGYSIAYSFPIGVDSLSDA